MSIINLAEHLFSKPKSVADCDVVVVSDMFLSDYNGGAELTTEALIKASPFDVCRVHSRDVTVEMLQQGHGKHWIFGNFSSLNTELIPTIVGNMSYSIISFDFHFCRYRSPMKHNDIEKTQCDCQNEDRGKLVSAFLYGAKSLWWMSEKQMDVHHKAFPFLSQRPNMVLSSVFDDETFARIKLLNSKQLPRKGNIVCGSPSWVKGTDDAVAYCNEHGLEHRVIWGLPYEKMLEELAQAEGLVFLPKGEDTCPRLVIEAKLLGCKLHLNDNVQHRHELWFDTDNMFDTEAYLYAARETFWNGIRADIEYRPTISGYTTTKDCISQDYPFIECITSMLGFCDEVVIVDGGSTDGTWERLQSLAASDARIVIHQQKRDWNHKRFAVFDGAQKALARSLCTKTLCWQQDSDEIVHEDDYQKVRDVAKILPKNIPVLSLPVIEYWGGPDKVRMDINVWKWRLSWNAPTTTHGIPRQLRKFDNDGELFSAPGSDGCDYVRHDTFDIVPAASFYTPDVEQVRQAAFSNPDALKQFEEWFNQAIRALPSVHHYSWLNINRKIKTYKNYWSKHWESLYDIKQEDTADNNKFFDKRWSDVSDDEIDTLAKRLRDEMGGWVFHQKIDFSRPTPSIRCQIKHPKVIEEWMKRNGVGEI